MIIVERRKKTTFQCFLVTTVHTISGLKNNNCCTTYVQDYQDQLYTNFWFEERRNCCATYVQYYQDQLYKDFWFEAKIVVLHMYKTDRINCTRKGFRLEDGQLLYYICTGKIFTAVLQDFQDQLYTDFRFKGQKLLYLICTVLLRLTVQ